MPEACLFACLSVYPFASLYISTDRLYPRIVYLYANYANFIFL